MDPAHLNKLFCISNWLFLIPCYCQNSIGDLWNTLVPTYTYNHNLNLKDKTSQKSNGEEGFGQDEEVRGNCASILIKRA